MMKALFLSWFIAGPALAAEVDSTSRTCSELVAEWYAKRISYEFKIPKDTSIAVVVSKPMDEAIIKFMNNHSILKKASSLSKHDRWSAYAKLSSEDIQSLANIMNEYDPDVLNSCQRLHSKIELKCPHQETTNVLKTTSRSGAAVRRTACRGPRAPGRDCGGTGDRRPARPVRSLRRRPMVAAVCPIRWPRPLALPPLRPPEPGRLG